ncbi:hypothetical protein PHYPO_G00076920 [Pangasianodon hypophthalmus]|uniref:Uncharacterized protein n=1 Tax=Pangasianodon hypophthalmus TaxID=310915 RepID=A0A5N5LMP1_PANHP|nr:hypothetical protein PHYPO_G00076920 [Pangasianodon hypophthalmus]
MSRGCSELQRARGRQELLLLHAIPLSEQVEFEYSDCGDHLPGHPGHHHAHFPDAHHAFEAMQRRHTTLREKGRRGPAYMFSERDTSLTPRRNASWMQQSTETSQLSGRCLKTLRRSM